MLLIKTDILVVNRLGRGINCNAAGFLIVAELVILLWVQHDAWFAVLIIWLDIFIHIPIYFIHIPIRIDIATIYILLTEIILLLRPQRIPLIRLFPIYYPSTIFLHHYLFLCADLWTFCAMRVFRLLCTN